MKKTNKIWVTKHARDRFIGRILAQYGKFSAKKFKSITEVYKFLGKLARVAIQKQNRENGLAENQYRVPWPYSSEPLPDLILVFDEKNKVLKTCWLDNSKCLNPDVFRLEKENN